MNKEQIVDCMIYKTKNDSNEEKIHYQEKISNLAEQIAKEFWKGKIPLIITGSGISQTVPNMKSIMKKIEDLINENEGYSSVFSNILEEYKSRQPYDEHTQQSRLLTYIQNAYLDRNRYVQSEDVEPLKAVWTKFVLWLLEGDDKYKGVLKAKQSKAHNEIAKMYKEMNAISITTNFDNLLKKAFEQNENFYPILEKETFNKYFNSIEDDDSYIEIQSRGDVFWVSCTGEKNKTCSNMNKRCYVPGEILEVENEITCKECGSKAKVYFAFPGTKEKDAEMASVMEGVWKYFAYKVSAIIIIGNSMDYDPVLLQFTKELVERKNIPVLYISSFKENEKGIVGIEKKAATKMLFRNYETTNNIWARANNTEEILSDLVDEFKKVKRKYKREPIKQKDLDRRLQVLKKDIEDCFSTKKQTDFDNVINRLLEYREGIDILQEDKVCEMKHYSQLGLKTFWLEGQDERYQLHNRYKHSVGVMLLASYFYLKAKKNPTEQELNFLKLAAFFHDIGHLPFSHMLEEIFQEFGWIAVGEIDTFNHEQHTKQIVRDLVENNDKVENALKQTGYTVEDLLQLIGGEFGIGYLDALINSPIDCDKIEYLYSDAIFTGRGTKDDLINFLEEYAAGLSSNDNTFLVVAGTATKSVLNLLGMRGRMYEDVYLRKGLRYLEACCKLIIRTFIAGKCSEEELFRTIKDRKFARFYNLSEMKIDYIIKWFEDKLSVLDNNEVCEIFILREMVEEIKQMKFVSDEMKQTISKCFDRVSDTKQKQEVATIENEMVTTYNITDQRFSKKRLKDMMKNVYLRFPGVLLVDYVESKTMFSFGKTGYGEKRTDGTKSPIEEILITDICNDEGQKGKYKCLGESVQDINGQLHFSQHTYINFYRITEDSFRYMQAEDYVLSKLREEGVI